MYLRNLEEKEKIGFLELAYGIANSDNDFSQVEIDMLLLFREEMLISEEKYQIQKLNLKDSMNMFKESSINNKKIVVLEMLGIVLADEIIAIEEEDILNKMIVKLNLDSDFLEKSKKTVLNLKNAYKDLNELFL